MEWLPFTLACGHRTDDKGRVRMDLLFRTEGGLELRDSSPDFEGHGLSPILEDGEIISYAGRRWLVRREPDKPESYICTPADDRA